MIKKFFISAAVILLAFACSKGDFEQVKVENDDFTVYTAKVECNAVNKGTKAYDADLNWYWEGTDAMCAYQVAGYNIRNTFKYLSESASFVCEAFSYMSTDPASFHFIYPAAAEVSEGVLVAPQDGNWKPVSVTIVSNATIESLPTLSFQMLSAAFEIRVFCADKQTPFKVVGAKLTSEQDFVGRWILNTEDMTYEQSLSGKEMVVVNPDFNGSVVTFNMPDHETPFPQGTLKLTLYDADGGSMTRSMPEINFVKGKRSVLNVVYTPDPSDDDKPVVPDPDEPGTITGTFTCATYNVDGLPQKILGFISLNDDGPGSNGTSAISSKIATSGWDVVTFQENFTYNDELVSAMNANYTFGTHRKFSLLSALGTADTDGLGFATLNSTCSFSGETWEAFSNAYGGLTDGANTSLKKGIRHYVVTFKDGVKVDFLVTHMNSGSDAGHISAREGQLKQIAQYINLHLKANNRPIVFMGDLNCRYTRDDINQYLFSNLDDVFTYADPWVEHSWGGVYPTLGSPSMMVPSKDASSTLTEQTGEVVDKIIYLNNVNAPTQIKSMNYAYDTDFAGMADHNPVRAKFEYRYTPVVE